MIDPAIVGLAWQRTGKPDAKRFQFVCYCTTCAAIRRMFPRPDEPRRPDTDVEVSRVDPRTGLMHWTEGDKRRLRERVARVKP